MITDNCKKKERKRQADSMIQKVFSIDKGIVNREDSYEKDGILL